MLKKLELTNKQYDVIKRESKKRKIKYIFSPFDETSLNNIKKFNLDFIKFHQVKLIIFVLQKIAKLRKKLFYQQACQIIVKLKTH